MRASFFGRHAPAFVSATLLSVAAACAHATVEAGHWQLAHRSGSGSGGSLGSVSVTVDQTIEGDVTGTIFDYDVATGKLDYITHNVDEGSELFLVTPGSVLSAQTAISLTSFLKNPEPIQVGQEFYLGAGTRSASDPGFQWADGAWTSWGWAHVKLDRATGKLAIVDSAMAFREPGIVVGTLQAVPEPATWAMMAMGALGLSVLRKTRRSNRG